MALDFEAVRDGYNQAIPFNRHLGVPIGIEMTDEGGQVVATMTVHWHVRLNG